MTVRILKLCEYATKLENGRHALIGIFEDIRVPQLPIDHPPFFLAAQMQFDSAECGSQHTLRFEVLDPTGAAVLDAEVPAQVEQTEGGDGPLATLLIQVQTVRLTKTGVHTVQVSMNGKVSHSEPLPVAIVKVR